MLSLDGDEKIATAKAATAGVYLSGAPITDAPPTLLWGRRMTYSSALASGTAIVGSFLLGAELVLKGTLRLAASNSDQDDFVKNLTTFRAEIRAALCTSVPKAFGLVTGLLGT